VDLDGSVAPGGVFAQVQEFGDFQEGGEVIESLFVRELVGGLADEAADFVVVAGARTAAVSEQPLGLGVEEFDLIGLFADGGEVGVLPGFAKKC